MSPRIGRSDMDARLIRQINEKGDAEAVVRVRNMYWRWGRDEESTESEREYWLTRAAGMEEALTILGYETSLNLNTGEISICS